MTKPEGLEALVTYSEREADRLPPYPCDRPNKEKPHGGLRSAVGAYPQLRKDGRVVEIPPGEILDLPDVVAAIPIH